MASPNPKRTTAAREVDRYLATLSTESRAALETLRQTIRSVVPEATEMISYGVPTFKLNNRMLVSYAGFKNHCSFFPGAGPINVHHHDLKEYGTSKGTVRFTTDRPLPPALIRKMVKTRIRLNAERVNAGGRRS